MTLNEFLQPIKHSDMRYMHGFRMVRRYKGKTLPNEPVAMAAARRGIKIRDNNYSNMWFLMSHFCLNFDHLRSFVNRWDQLILDKGGNIHERVNISRNEMQGLVDEIEMGV